MASITISLFYDLDLLLWTSAAGGIARQPNLVLGQSDSIAFAVQFVRSGVVIELTSPQFICGIKPINDVAGDYLCQTTTGTKTGTGTSTVYTFTLLLDSTELRAWLLTVTAVSNYAAFSIRDTVNLIATLPAITCTILPDYTLEGTTPTAASGTLIVASGQTFTVNKTFAMPVDDGTDGFVLKTDGAGVGSWVANTAGAVTSVGLGITGGGTVLSITNSPITSSGTIGITTAGTSGGLLYFSSTNTMGSTATLGLGALLLGGGSGGSPTALASVASGRVLTSMGVNTTPAYSSTITLGASGTLGTITLGNATSGTILITPPTGALGTPTLTLPITSTTLAGLAVTQAFTAANTFSLTTDATSSTVGGSVTISGGLAVAKKAFIGTLLDLVATTSTAGQITQAGTRMLHTYGFSGNLFVGSGAGNFTLDATSTGAISNVGFGREALKGLTDGQRNCVFGDAVAILLTSGDDNTIFGTFAGSALTTANGSTAIGKSALGANQTSIRNTAIGMNALTSCLAASNVGIGFNAGHSLTGTANTNAFNVCIGYGAGSQAQTIGGITSALLTTGTNNTMLGTYAGSTSASGTYRTAVGSDSICQNNNAIKLGRDENDVVILPSMTTTQRNAYATPVGGSLIFNVTTGKLNFYNSTAATPAWEAVTSI